MHVQRETSVASSSGESPARTVVSSSGIARRTAAKNAAKPELPPRIPACPKRGHHASSSSDSGSIVPSWPDIPPNSRNSVAGGEKGKGVATNGAARAAVNATAQALSKSCRPWASAAKFSMLTRAGGGGLSGASS